MASTTQEIIKLLFPEGFTEMPTEESLLQKVQDGNFTFRDALKLDLIKKGISISNKDKEDDLVKQFDDLLPNTKKPTKAIGFLTTVKKFANNLDEDFLTAYKGKKEATKKYGESKLLALQALDANLTKLTGEEDIKIPRAAITGVVQARDTKKFKSVPPPEKVWPEIITAAQEIANDVNYGPEFARVFLLTSILPNRAIDLTQIHITKAGAESGEATRPYLYKRDGVFSITLPSEIGRGQKGFPTYKMTEFLSNLLEPNYKDVLAKGGSKLFSDKITTASLTRATNKYFKPKMDKYIDDLGRPVRGISDLRKISSSTIAKHPRINNPDIASQLLGHGSDGSYVEGLSKIDTKHYISDIAGVGADERVQKTLRMYENLIADVLNYEDINEIARSAGIPIANDNKILKIDFDDVNKRDIEPMSDEDKKDLEDRRKLQRETYKVSEKEKQASLELSRQEKLKKAQETKQARKAGLEEAPKKPVNFKSEAVEFLIDEFNISQEEIQEIKSLPADQQNTALDELLKNKKPITKDVKPEGQAMVAEPEMKTPFLDIEGAGDVAAIDMEKAERVIDPLVDVVTSLPAGRVAKAAVTIGKGLGKALKPDVKDPIERFDILEPLPEEEEKETTEERTRGQINNLFDSPLGP